MFFINFKRIIKTGFINFWRNGVVSLSAVMVMSVTLLIIASVMFTSALLNHTLDELKDKVDVNINIVPTAFEDDILLLKKSLESLPEVEQVTYINREQVLENYKARHVDDHGLIAAIDALGENPLGATLLVKAKNPERYADIQIFLEQNYPANSSDSIISKINYVNKQLIIDRLNGIVKAGEQLGAIVTFIFILLSILITLNTIRLAMFISRDEIKVMNLVGADNSYISGPFIITGAMYGFFSAIFVLALLYPITYWIGPKISEAFFDLNIFNYYMAHFGEVFVVILGAGVVIGSISSFLAVNRYIKK